MWSCEVVIPKYATPFNKILVTSVSAASLPRRRRHEFSANANLQPNPKPQEQGEISGSDVLWALQRASARKKFNKNKNWKKNSSSVRTPMEQTAVDYTNVRPLSINASWGPKLDELEKRLRERMLMRSQKAKLRLLRLDNLKDAFAAAQRDLFIE